MTEKPNEVKKLRLVDVTDVFLVPLAIGFQFLNEPFPLIGKVLGSVFGTKFGFKMFLNCLDAQSFRNEDQIKVPEARIIKMNKRLNRMKHRLGIK